MDILTPYEFYTSICSLPNFSASKKYIPSEQSQFMQDCWSWVLPALLLVLHPPFFPRSFTGHPLFAHSLLPILRITWRFQLKPFIGVRHFYLPVHNNFPFVSRVKTSLSFSKNVVYIEEKQRGKNCLIHLNN